MFQALHSAQTSKQVGPFVNKSNFSWCFTNTKNYLFQAQCLNPSNVSTEMTIFVGDIKTLKERLLDLTFPIKNLYLQSTKQMNLTGKTQVDELKSLICKTQRFEGITHRVILFELTNGRTYADLDLDFNFTDIDLEVIYEHKET